MTTFDDMLTTGLTTFAAISDDIADDTRPERRQRIAGITNEAPDAAGRPARPK
jgi:hypothetical protein